MYGAEHIFNTLTPKELYLTLKSLTIDDCYLSEYLGNDLIEDFLYLLEMHELIRISSDDRLLLTEKGEKLLQNLVVPVELSRISNKILRNKKS
jgi:hypothetical protein